MRAASFQHLIMLACATCTALASCSGTDTGNPLRDASVSSCKSRPDADAEDRSDAQAAALTLSSDTTRYNGLFCLRWQRGDDALSLQAFNFPGSCSVWWKTLGHVHRDVKADRVSVAVRNPSCNIAACGSCIYDAAFEVDTTTIALADDAEIPFSSEDCHGKATALGSFTLNAKDASGVSCEYDHTVDWTAAIDVSKQGTENMPCRGELGGTDPNAPACDAGLRCIAVADSDSRCLKQCTQASDCAVPEVMSCSQGVCDLR